MNPKTLSAVIFLTLLLGACAPLVTAPEIPATIATEDAPGTTNGVAIQSIKVEIISTQSLQINVILRGQLPDAGCTTFQSVEQVREGNTIKLTLVTTTDPLALCAPESTPFVKVVPLDVRDLPAGIYRLEAHGVEQYFQVVDDLIKFKQNLVEALNARDYDELKTMMDRSLVIAQYRSQGRAYKTETAIEQLKLNHLNGTSRISEHPNQDTGVLLNGLDPLSIFGIDVGPNQALFVSGLGLDGKDEAILYLNYRQDGSLYWHGLMVSKGGFAD